MNTMTGTDTEICSETETVTGDETGLELQLIQNMVMK